MGLDFESSLDLNQVSEDTFENVHQPWTWWDAGVVPGPVTMSMCAAAAYRTVSKGFILHNLQTHFLLAANSEIPFLYKVRRASSGRRFAVRVVTVEQEGKDIISTTISFVSGSPWKGPALTHSVERRVKENVERITMNDLGERITDLGPFMAFQRLPILRDGQPKTTQSSVAPYVAKITSPIQAPTGSAVHILAIINLSDYHVGDAPLALSGLTFGLRKIGDTSGDLTEMSHKLYTSLNHSIHFHSLDGFRADELTYIEASSPWAKDGRAMVNTRIFSKNGTLIATCIQETFTILKDDITPPRAGKL